MLDDFQRPVLLLAIDYCTVYCFHLFLQEYFIRTETSSSFVNYADEIRRCPKTSEKMFMLNFLALSIFPRLFLVTIA